MHEHHLQSFPQPASNHHRVIAEAHDTAMFARFDAFDSTDNTTVSPISIQDA